jgi:hypothetical protein
VGTSGGRCAGGCPDTKLMGDGSGGAGGGGGGGDESCCMGDFVFDLEWERDLEEPFLKTDFIGCACDCVEIFV